MPLTDLPFGSLYRHGFARVAVCVPPVRIADPAFNAARTVELARAAAEDAAVLAVFPELGLSAYSNEDLFHQDALLADAEEALATVLEASRSLGLVLVVGAPLRTEGGLFNCGVVMHRGRILGIAPKSYLPNYREFYEKRQFTSGLVAAGRQLRLLGQDAPFGNDLVFQASDLPGFALHVEVCEDLWAPIPPSTFAALAGATVLVNLSASNITIGKAAWRRTLCAAQSGRCLAAYLYGAAGLGESTTDLAWDGHAMIYENGTMLAESGRFGGSRDLPVANCENSQLTTQNSQLLLASDLDLDRLRQERMRVTTFADSVHRHREQVAAVRRVVFGLAVPEGPVPLRRTVERFPYVPHDPAQWDQRCYEAYHIQVHGLQQRLAATGIRKVVIGVSGGLDSTQALIVCCRAMDRLGLPRSNVLAYTLPGFATSGRTKANAWRIMRALGVTAAEIDIRPACTQMLKDLGHPFSRGEPLHDVTFENVQAGQRTSVLFRLANQNDAIVVGTGDLSELALGWTTYGVGDQMSHYNVNASVPKTLIQHLVRWEIERGELGGEARDVLRSILDTVISPELVPDNSGEPDGGPGQCTEDVIGPYELQDFNLYYISRFGFLPSKVAYLAQHAWSDASGGQWPPGFPEAQRRQYDLATIKKWLGVFLRRFFQLSQFKRSAMPNGPKVGSGGSLSPRGDWRAPSDATATVWLEELERNVPGDT